MKTGLTKKQKRTSIYFTEADDFVESAPTTQTSKSDCRNLPSNIPQNAVNWTMTETAAKPLPSKKGRFGIRLTAPYSEKRRQAASELAKKNTQNLRRTTK